MPEFCAPALGNKPNTVTLEVEFPNDPEGVLYALGSNSGGLTCFIDEGRLVYEYNLFILQRTKIRSESPLPTGPTTIEVVTTYAEPRPGGPLDVVLSINGAQVAAGRVPISAPLLFTANDCLDVGTCLGSPISLDYRERAPFPFNGAITRMHVAYHTL
jgi:arylsulfatase